MLENISKYTWPASPCLTENIPVITTMVLFSILWLELYVYGYKFFVEIWEHGSIITKKSHEHLYEHSYSFKQTPVAKFIWRREWQW